MQTMTLEQMKNVNIRTVNIDDLVDIRYVKINRKKPKDKRIKDLFEKVNPYCYKVGNVAVKASFPNIGVTLDEKLATLFIKNYNISKK